MGGSIRRFLGDAASQEWIPYASRYALGTCLFGLGAGFLLGRIAPAGSLGTVLIGCAVAAVLVGWILAVTGYGRLRRSRAAREG